MAERKRRAEFALRLAVSLKDRATYFAQREGISLNQFISLALAEKISRLETESQHDLHVPGLPPKPRSDKPLTDI